MNSLSQLAPIALFVYNRPYHTQQTIEALLKNPEAKDSTLFVYSDGPRNADDEAAVGEIRTYIRSLDGFADIQIINRGRNIGLAESITQGVTDLCERYGRVIVMEDDLVTSPAFLGFMNRALEFYHTEKRVWHISGWNYPIEPDGIEPAFFWETMNCWGWATWQDRWTHFKKDPVGLVQSWSPEDVQAFNINGAFNFWKQVVLNKNGKLNTWAVFWYATIFENKGLCLNPAKTLVTNIGHDGSGENCRKAAHFSTFSDLELDSLKLPLPLKIECSELAKYRIKRFLNNPSDGNFFMRILKKLKHNIDWVIYR